MSTNEQFFPTGNVLRDPDSGRPLNPHNVHDINEDGAGINKLRPELSGGVATEAPVPVQHAPVQAPSAQQLRAAANAAAAAGDETNVMQVIRTAGPMARKGDALAQRTLADLAAKEYARTDGGNRAIRGLLGSFGVGKPPEGD